MGLAGRGLVRVCSHGVPSTDFTLAQVILHRRRHPQALIMDPQKRIRKIGKISRKTGRRLNAKPVTKKAQEAVSGGSGGSGRTYENIPSHVRDQTSDYVVRLFGRWDPTEWVVFSERRCVRNS